MPVANAHLSRIGGNRRSVLALLLAATTVVSCQAKVDAEGSQPPVVPPGESVAPSIPPDGQPQSKTVMITNTATFSVKVNGTEPFTYQWKRDGRDIPGANSASYTTLPTAVTDNQAKFQVVVTNEVGSAASDVAILTVVSSGSTGFLDLISLDQPVYSSEGDALAGASFVGESIGSEAWEVSPSAWPAWMAYDLSAVPAEKRQTVIVYRTNGQDGRYDNAFARNVIGTQGIGYTMPGPYLIEANQANGGGSPPESGWERVGTNEEYPGEPVLAREQHIVALAGYTWIRINVTGPNTHWNQNPERFSIKFFIYDARGVEDDILFVGDSITENAWSRNSFGAKVNLANPSRHPIGMGAGDSFASSEHFLMSHPSGGTWFDRFLSRFPGKYVALCIGTNDSMEYHQDDYLANMTTMVEKIIAADKIPVIPPVPYNPPAGDNAFFLEADAKLGVVPGDLSTVPPGSVRARYPQVMAGPDLFTLFYNNPDLMDGIHPNDAGYELLRLTWAQWAADNIYSRP